MKDIDDPGYSAQARIAGLEASLERAFTEIEHLRQALGVTFAMPRDLGLTGKEGAVLAMILKRNGVISRIQLMDGLYGFLDEEPDVKIVDVFVCKIRKKIEPFGLKINSIWGIGYECGPETRARFAELWPHLDTQLRAPPAKAPLEPDLARAGGGGYR